MSLPPHYSPGDREVSIAAVLQRLGIEKSDVRNVDYGYGLVFIGFYNGFNISCSIKANTFFIDGGTISLNNPLLVGALEHIRLTKRIRQLEARNTELETVVAKLRAEIAELRLSPNPGPDYLAAMKRFDEAKGHLRDAN